MKPPVYFTFLAFVLLALVGAGVIWLIADYQTPRAAPVVGLSNAAAEANSARVAQPEVMLARPEAESRTQAQSKAGSTETVVIPGEVENVTVLKSTPELSLPLDGDTKGLSSIDPEAWGQPFAEKYKTVGANERAASRQRLQDVLRGIANGDQTLKLGEREIAELKNEAEWLNAHPFP